MFSLQTFTDPAHLRKLSVLTLNGLGRLQRLLRYRIDNALTKGVTVVLIWVGVALLFLVAAVGSAAWMLHIGPNDQPTGLLENLWLSLTRSLDPGTFGADEGRYFRAAGLIVTLGGLLAVSLVIGLISNAVDSRLDHLRRGRSLVVESGHTLILGYSSKLPIVVRELMQANESNPGHALVILSPQDKVDLEEALRRELPANLHSRLVVRRGEPSSMHDLAQVQPETAKSVVVLRPDGESADAEVARVTLAVQQARRQSTTIAPVIAELDDASIASALRQALPQNVVPILSSDIIGRIAAQTARAAGMGTVYQELLDFEGDEFYVSELPNYLHDQRFSAALFSSRDCTIIGLISASNEVEICPEMSRVLREDDRLILIAADDSVVKFDAPENTYQNRKNLQHGQLANPLPRTVERTLMIGWNRYASRILAELDAQALPGSQLTVLIDSAAPEGFSEEMISSLRNYVGTVLFGSITNADLIDSCISAVELDHILILCAHDALTSIEADARSLLALVHVRNQINRRGSLSAVNLVSEMLRTESVELAQIAQPDDFIVSQRLVSLYMAQVAEDPMRQQIIDRLLEPSGPRLVFVPTTELSNSNSVTFGELVEQAASLGDVAVGWRSSTVSDSALPGGIRLNPGKAESIAVSVSNYAILLTRR